MVLKVCDVVGVGEKLTLTSVPSYVPLQSSHCNRVYKAPSPQRIWKQHLLGYASSWYVVQVRNSGCLYRAAGSEELYSGWSTAYSVQSILIQLQAFLFEIPATGSEWTQEHRQAKEAANNFSCTVCPHKPFRVWPEFPVCYYAVMGH